MTEFYEDNSWLPQSVRDADAALDEAVLRSNDKLKELEKQQITSSGPPKVSDEDIKRVVKEAKSPKATPEMRALQKKVDAGDVTWRDILEGRAFSDPEVRAALQSKLTQLRDVYQEYEQGYTLDDVLDAHRRDAGSYDDDEPQSFLQ
jgi:hypothetical protein